MTLKDDWEQVAPEKPPLQAEWIQHFSQKQPGPELLLIDTLRQRYPGHAVVSSTKTIDFFSIPGVHISPLPGAEPPISHVVYLAPAHRGSQGAIAEDIQFAQYRLEFQNEGFLMVRASWRESYSTFSFTAVLREGGSEAKDLCEELMLVASAYAAELREQILVYDQGSWSKDHALWVEIQKANWDDVILDEPLKSTVRNDIDSFFKSESIFKELAIPWKRGVIMYGPPGNGKTISTKAIMKSTEVPSLYVKSFQSWMGPEASIRQVFTKARAMAPCLLILEDLDSLIDEQTRSFFLNELDGLESNDGILVIGSTNHLNRLDPSLSNRPSRFDRKFEFDDPTLHERVLYCQYWQKKLASNDKIKFPDPLVEHLASLTDGFSFAYLKEAFISSLVSIATGNETGPFEEVIEKQVKALRKEIKPKAPKKSDTSILSDANSALAMGSRFFRLPGGPGPFNSRMSPPPAFDHSC